MARAWKQITPGTRRLDLDWPAGTLPTAESIQSVGFLNQFIGWMRYIGNFTWNDYLPEFVTAGMNIQTASFWNQIGQFNPLASPDYTDNVWMELGTDAPLAANDIITTANTLAASSDYAALLEASPIVAGQDIHPTTATDCFILNMLLRARTRLDMCRVLRNGTNDFTAQTPIDILHSWTLNQVGIGEYTSQWLLGGHSGGDESNILNGPAIQMAKFTSASASTWTSAMKAKKTVRRHEDCPHGVAISTITTYRENSYSSSWTTADGEELVCGAASDISDGDEIISSIGQETPVTGNSVASNNFSFYVTLPDTLPAQFQPT